MAVLKDNIFILDTSSDACTLALSSRGKIFSFHESGKLKHQEILIPAFQSLLESAGISACDLNQVYFGQGPGSFTGCRISAAFTQGLAIAKEMTYLSLSSFGLLAQGIYKALGYEHIAIAEDAQKNQIYFAAYQLDKTKKIMRPVISPCLINPEDLALPSDSSSENSNKTWVASGNAWFLMHEKLSKRIDFSKIKFDRYAENWQIRAEDGFDLIAQGEIFPPDICYLRPASDWVLVNPLKTYTVGGAVRDELLGLSPHEIDTLVIGSTPEIMQTLGFIPVGKHFPVFLHPVTHAEFALARTERKIAKGHQGFEFYTSPEITVEEDLGRRDFTMNAIAKDSSGNLIDPYQGQEDIKNRIIRHVSTAFIEDPLRVFRGARFMAQLADFNFNLAPETLSLMIEIAKSGELESLSDERIWEESLKALKYPRADLYFEVLNYCGALKIIFDFNSDFGADSENFKKNINHLKKINLKNLENIKFAVLAFKLKIKIKIPNSIQDLINLSEKNYLEVLNFKTPEDQVNLFEKMDAFRRPERFWESIQVCEVLAESENKIINKKSLERALLILNQLNLQKLASKYSGLEIQKKIHQARVKELDVKALDLRGL